MFKTEWMIFLLSFLCISVCVGQAKGRYVNISIPGKGTLSLAEVQVFQNGKNIALKKKAIQTSTAYGGNASRAVDGNTSGDFGKNSVTHTTENYPNPAWEVDLGKSVDIEKISVWNRNGSPSRLNGAEVLILDESRKSVWGSKIAKAKRGETVFDTTKPGEIKKLGIKIPKIKRYKPGEHPPLPYASNKYNVTPEENRGILNGPLVKRKVPKPMDQKESLRLAIEDLIATFGDKYPEGKNYLEKLKSIKSAKDPQFEILKKEALLANPLIDFDKLLIIKRKGLSMPANWQGNSSMHGGDKFPVNELCTLSVKDGKLATVYKPEKPLYVGQFDLDYDADKILFTSITDNKSWGVFEIKIDPVSGKMIPGSFRQVSPDMGADVDNYDAVYLPSGKIIFDSSSGYAGVPCVGGNDYVANLHSMNSDGSDVQRLCFDQDNDWNPVVMEDGRIMYLRWEYTDSAHYFSRILMYMNPDGTDQKSFYGSNSYWPNTMFFARPIPGNSSKFVAIVSAHHGPHREGAMVLFDAAKGRHEADGAIQLIGERGNKVEPIVQDNLANKYRTHYLTPYPLSDKYFLASINQGGWKICLVDVFDNIVILKDEPGWCLFEPVPLKKRKRPPALVERVRPEEKEATIWISDVHFGPGLRELPKGTAKYMRVYRYEYAPRNAGGHYVIGMESCWDTHTVLGTVPLEKDGSVMFKVPANTPISLQPLDKDKKALQIMRSWLVARPGETLSCIGCHEETNLAPPMKMTLASRKAPQPLSPWYGPARGFSYEREVQPVLDKYCVACHSPEGMQKPAVKALISKSKGRIGTGKDTGKLFSEKGIPDLSNPKKSYYNIHPFVRRNGPEGDYHILTPMEFHADTSELIQMLQKGHHNVKLDKEAWDRLITWIDINVPYYGTWSEAVGKDKKRAGNIKRRLELREKYCETDFDPEKIIKPYVKKTASVMPQACSVSEQPSVKVSGWPFSKESALTKQGDNATIQFDLGDKVTMKFARIPAGSFIIGSNNETEMERPVSEVSIKKPFWMETTEVTLEQYRQFDPNYLNGVYDMHNKDQVHRGYYMNNMKYPVIRVTWEKANEYCRWLSKKIGKKVSLPTEAQWEWACRAGSATPFSYGGLDTNFSKFANLADLTTKELAVSGINPKPIYNPSVRDDYLPKDPRFYDKTLHLAPVGTYKPNAWGLYDMHGNVKEWTRSDYKPYPYSDENGKGTDKAVRKVVRGGSWRDRPCRSTSSYRLGFPKWQQVYNTGFRVIIED